MILKSSKPLEAKLCERKWGISLYALCSLQWGDTLFEDASEYIYRVKYPNLEKGSSEHSERSLAIQLSYDTLNVIVP